MRQALQSGGINAMTEKRMVAKEAFMNHAIMRLILASVAVVLTTMTTFAQEQEDIETDTAQLEGRLDHLEQEVRELRSRIESMIEPSSDVANKDEDRRTQDSTSHAEEAGEPLGIEVKDISYHDSNAANDYANDYRDWISLSFELTNNLSDDIRAVRGVVAFFDLFDEEWWDLRITVNDPIAAGETIEWNGSVNYNSFIDEHRQARNTVVEDVYVEIRELQLLMADGERLTF
jgi:hypothetical protein